MTVLYRMIKPQIQYIHESTDQFLLHTVVKQKMF